MSKKLRGIVALVGLCALSLFSLSCGSSSSRPSGVVYVLTQGSNGFGNNVSSFALDLNSGGLSLINSNASTCNGTASNGNPEPCGLPLDILLDPAGANAFVLNQGTPCQIQNNQCITGSNPTVLPTIYSYSVNSDGSLSVPGSTPTYWTCIQPSGTGCSQSNSLPDTAISMVMDAAGQFLFVIDQGLYPSPTSCPAIASPVTNAQQATDFIGCPSISVFSIKGNALTLVSQSANYQSPLFLSKIPTGISPVTPPNLPSTIQELLFATNNFDLCTVGCGLHPHNDNTVSVYGVQSSGVLVEQSNSPYSIAAVNPISVFAVTTFPAGQTTGGGVFVYVGNEGQTGGSVSPFELCTAPDALCSSEDVSENLLLPVTACTPPTSCVVTAGQSPIQMLTDPTNNFLYVLSEGSSQVFEFRIGSSTGSLTSPTNAPTGSQPVSMAMHPSVNNSGQYLYVSNTASSNITGFTLSTTSGTMADSLSVVAPASPSGIAVH
jgi:hypothetical protein